MIRNAYLKKVESRLEHLREDIESLKRKADGATADVREIISRQSALLQAKADTARDRIKVVQAAGETSWGRLKKGADDALDDLKKAVDATFQRFRRTGTGKR
ncbi:MAG: hypothetical protein C4529_00055 [Deltaproteobacteria bacterium]|nr:MAG: hypothetical protein C4529_00055 [Deltaproteobacteria bacterium]